MAQPQPLIKFRQPQEEAFLCSYGLLFLIWRRQFGKSYTLAAKALDWMMETPGILVTFISAALRLGQENIRKEAEVWQQVMKQLKAEYAANGLAVTTTADDDHGHLLDIDAIADLFEHQKLETKLWFDNVTHSRSIVIAPNPDTAVGWTGHLILDEVGRMPNFREMWEAAEPFVASNPQYRILGATTPPPDDSHYSYELLAPEDDKFEVNPRGNFYTSQLGIPCHRVDSFDAYAAGVPIYDLKTREPLDPEEARRRALDKDAHDRNFRVKFIKGGSAALSIDELNHAAKAGAHMCMAVDIREQIAV
jgi:hypothetical protein